MSSEEGRVPWQESNLALIGSDLDHKIKEAAASQEEQWSGLADAAEPQLKIWRIEQFRVVPWPSEKYGRFHVGDSYLILKSSYLDDENEILRYDLHFWIGSESSQDEYGTVAYKTVECDDSLGGAAVQHREVQGHESELFRSYFSDGLYYLQGGVASGFRHVEEGETPHVLYRVKGTDRAMSLTQMPSVDFSSLNAGDCFILFCGADKVFLWNGEQSNPDERHRANALAESMATEGTVVVLDQGAENEEGGEEFGAALSGEAGDIGDATEGDGDEEVEEFVPTLFQLPGDADGAEPVEVAKGEPIKIGWARATPKFPRGGTLHTADVFLLDAGWELFVWQGKESDRGEKLAAMAHVDRYAKTVPRAQHLPVTIIKEGYETFKFQSFFFDE